MKREEMAWSAYGSVICDGKMWYTNYWGTQLCCFSLTEKRMMRIEMIPYEGKRSELLYSNIIALNDGRLVLVPANAFEICIYNIANREFELIPIEASEEAYNMFCGAVAWKDYIYLIPYNFRYVVRLDVNKRTIERVCDLENVVDLAAKPTAFQYNYLVNDNRVFFLAARENKILSFNLDEESIATLPVGDSDSVFAAIESIDYNNFVLIDQKGMIYQVAFDLSVWKKIDCIINDFVLKDDGYIVKSYADCKVLDKRIIFLPAHANKILEYQFDMGILKTIDFAPDMQMEFDDAHRANSIKFSLVKEYNGMLYGFYVKTGQLFEYDPKEQQFALYDTKLELDSEESQYLMNKMIKRGAVKESFHSYDSLEAFISAICNA